ncbi:hypothetical protein JXQ70_10035 [bacterium]|nr:hypothetical protein [bacterium]
MTRKELMKRDVPKFHAFKTAYNGHGLWHNARTTYMNRAVTTKWLRQQALYGEIPKTRIMRELD